MPSSLPAGDLASLANQALKDPKLLDQVMQRVHDLLQENLAQQREQIRPYQHGSRLV